jgi:hypothetical protein
LPGQIILVGIAVTDILTTGTTSALAGITMTGHLLFGDCQIIHLELLSLATRGYTLSMVASIMRR